jgi:hypothetical protein
METVDNDKISVFYICKILDSYENKKEFLHYLDNDTDECIIIDNTDDSEVYFHHDMQFWNEVHSMVEKNNKRVILLSNGLQHNEYNRFFHFEYDCFPLASLYSTYFVILLNGGVLPKKIDHGNAKSFQYFLKYLNNTPHWSRCYMTDNLKKHQILESSDTLFSWNQLQDEHHYMTDKYEFLHWNENKVIIDGLDTWTKQYQSNKIEKYNCLIELIGETPTDNIGFTEKTWKPILRGNIFTLFGVRNQNKRLQKYNFLLFDNLFDYSFDCLDIEYSIDNLISQIKKLRSKDYNEIYEKSINIINHNLQNAFDIIHHKKFVPSYLVNNNDKIYLDSSTYGIQLVCDIQNG